MLTVKNWCLPGDLSQDRLEELHNAIVAAVISVPETNITRERDMLNLFPPDMMSYGLGQEIRIEITDLPCKLLKAVRDRLATVVGEAVQKLFTEARIKCIAREASSNDGSWSSY